MTIGVDLNSGNDRDNGEAFVERAQLVRDAHAHVTIEVHRLALRMERDEVER